MNGGAVRIWRRIRTSALPGLRQWESLPGSTSTLYEGLPASNCHSPVLVQRPSEVSSAPVGRFYYTQSPNKTSHYRCLIRPLLALTVGPFRDTSALAHVLTPLNYGRCVPLFCGARLRADKIFNSCNRHVTQPVRQGSSWKSSNRHRSRVSASRSACLSTSVACH